jgi:UrcA family protein
MKTFTAFCAFVATMSSFVDANASAEQSAPRYRRDAAVQVADLDLTNRRDAYVLYERIGYAARIVCTTGVLSARRTEWSRCVRSAVDEAVDGVNAPLLTALHLQQRERLARL